MNFNFSTKESHSNLHEYLAVTRGYKRQRDGFFLRAESFYNVASNIDELGPTLLPSYGGKSLHKQSHGESFMALISNRFSGNGLYLFDEPEAGIDLWSFAGLIEAFQKLKTKNSGSILIISHQERILNIADEIVVIADGKVKARGSRQEIMPTLLADEKAAHCPRGKEVY